LIHIIDASQNLYAAYDHDHFSLKKWKAYMDKESPSLKDLCMADLEHSISPTYSWESNYLPVLNDIIHKKAEIEKVVRNYHLIVDALEKQIIDRFGKSIDVDVILYLGLCNGAGWVTDVQGRTSILLGIEKIVELQWCDIDSLNGLILHELGHVYQAQYGVLHREFQGSSDRFMWQLFTEGIAMVFEQEILGNREYLHQDKNGWKEWCDQNIRRIAMDFQADCQNMTSENQCYFGDWVDYKGYSDVGYYLGTRFVRFILEKKAYDNILGFGIEEVRRSFCEFIDSL